MREVKRPVFSFRLNLDNPDHKKAWEILQSVPDGQKSSYLVQVILKDQENNQLEKSIRQAIRIFLLALCSVLMGFLRMVLMMVNLFTLILYAGPVSYTHLDVYKRQQEISSGGKRISLIIFEYGFQVQ